MSSTFSLPPTRFDGMHLRRPIAYNFDDKNRRLMTIHRSSTERILKEWSLAPELGGSRVSLQAETLQDLESIWLTSARLLNRRCHIQSVGLVTDREITELENRLSLLESNQVFGPIVCHPQAPSCAPVSSAVSVESDEENSDDEESLNADLTSLDTFRKSAHRANASVSGLEDCGEGSGIVPVSSAAEALAATAADAGSAIAATASLTTPSGPNNPWMARLLIGMKSACVGLKNWILSVFSAIAALFFRRGR